MHTLRFAIHVNAPRKQVWHAMLDDATYREWTSAFSPGSYYKGSWEQGSSIEFLGPDPEGKTAEGGMFAEIAENRPYEFLSTRHLGVIENGVKKPWGADKPVYENYTFADKDGGTDVTVELTGIPDEYMAMYDDTWPKALAKLKEIAER